MTEVHLGRLLAASLHQAIGEELPMRLEFYEHWLNSEGLRDGSIGLGPMQAVLGFLRTEGEAYGRVMERAGRYAAEWALMSRPAGHRRLIGALPQWLRVRAALRLVRDVAATISTGPRVAIKVRRGTAEVAFAGSVFCAVRGLHPEPLCAFYRALVAETLRILGLGALVALRECRAMGATRCVVSLDLSASAESSPSVQAA